MSKNRGNKLISSSDMYWQSAYYNQMLYNQFRTLIINLAESRYKWLNLPKSCDERYLEQTLLFQGIATIGHPKRGKLKNVFVSTMVATSEHPNIYDNFTKWRSIGNNGWNFRCSPNNAVIIWDNKYRTSILPMIDMYARELTDIVRTKQINRLHQKMPFILTGPEESARDMTNIYKQIAGNEPAIIMNKGRSSMGIEVSTINTQVPFIGAELNADLEQTWNQVYKFLGIRNVTQKKERQIYGEINTQTYPDDLMEYGYIDERRKAADMLNDRFHLNIQVVKAQDNISENFNYNSNIIMQEEIGKKTGGSDNGTSSENR